MADETVNIEISFIPTNKCTYTAEVYLKIKQFDFKPLLIKVIGNGKEKDLGKTAIKGTSNKNTFKRLKSSKLVPLEK
jgi:hypothetical protein